MSKNISLEIIRWKDNNGISDCPILPGPNPIMTVRLVLENSEFRAACRFFAG